MTRLFRSTLFVLGCLLLTASVHAQGTYDATADYEAGWTSNSNPNGVWSYGWSTDLSTRLNLYTNAIQPTGSFIANGGNEHMWYSPSVNNGYAPAVALNDGPAIDNGNINFLANELVLTAGGPNVPLYSHVVFTTPTAGLYSIAAGFRGDQYGVHSDVNVLANGNSLFSAAITSEGQTASYTGEVMLSAGQTIDFAFGGDGAQSQGNFNTGFSAVVTAVPEAGSILILGIGLLGGGILLRNHRSCCSALAPSDSGV